GGYVAARAEARGRAPRDGTGAGSAAQGAEVHRRHRAEPSGIRNAIDINLKYRVRVSSFRFGLTPRVVRSTLASAPHVGRSNPVRRAGSTCFWEYSQADRQVEAAAGAAATEVSQP